MFVVTAIGDGIVWQFIMESNMRKLILYILAVAVTAMTIFSCKDVRNSEVYRLLTDVDSYIESRPDSALAVLEGIDKAELTSKELEAKYGISDQRQGRRSGISVMAFPMPRMDFMAFRF